ncbi:MAG: transglycosylase SLT domain-containing protein [candidate division KSB1 bacterium]|nr:transglycosylase SLT domain-containing protein [candidate division KSB1 bacterium]
MNIERITLKNSSESRPVKEPKPPEDIRLKRATQDFEALLVSYLLKSMRETVPESGFSDENLGKSYFQSLFDEEMAVQISRTSNLGLAEMLYRELSSKAIAPSASVAEKTPEPVPRFEPDEKLLQKVRRYQHIIQAASQKYQVDVHLIQAVMAQESSGNPWAVSSKGAKGLMQLMETTAQEMGVRNIFDPRENIFGGTKYLAILLERFNGDISLALAAYNAGPGAVEKYGGIPPYKETQNYIKMVLNYLKLFQKTD